MKVGDPGDLIDVEVQASKLLALLKHEGCDVLDEVVRDDESFQVGAALKAALDRRYFVHRDVEMDEFLVQPKCLTQLYLIESFVLHL